MNKFTKTIASLTLGSTILFSTFTAADAATYTVKKGDTLYGIAKKYNTNYKTIMKTNKLKSTKIKIGQKLTVNGKATKTAKAATKKTTTAKVPTSTAKKAAEIAKKHVGVRYVFGGTTPRGFDCSGLVYYSYKNAGKSIGRLTAAGFYNKAKKISSPQVGDLVFFKNTYKRGISHIGIYVGNGKMVNASGKKVKIEAVHSGYWKKHFAGYGRI